MQSADDIPILRFIQCQAHVINLILKKVKTDIEADSVLGSKLKTVLKFAVDASVKRSADKRKNPKCAPSFNALLIKNKQPTNQQKDHIGKLMFHNYADLSEERKNAFRKETMEFPLINIPKEIRWTSLYNTIESILGRFHFQFKDRSL